MFGRATITLGIGPYFIFFYFVTCFTRLNIFIIILTFIFICGFACELGRYINFYCIVLYWMSVSVCKTVTAQFIYLRLWPADAHYSLWTKPRMPTVLTLSSVCRLILVTHESQFSFWKKSEVVLFTLASVVFETDNSVEHFDITLFTHYWSPRLSLSVPTRSLYLLYTAYYIRVCRIILNVSSIWRAALNRIYLNWYKESRFNCVFIRIIMPSTATKMGKINEASIRPSVCLSHTRSSKNNVFWLLYRGLIGILIITNRTLHAGSRCMPSATWPTEVTETSLLETFTPDYQKVTKWPSAGHVVSPPSRTYFEKLVIISVCLRD